MTSYVLKRLLYGMLTLLVLATVVFFLMKSIPGSPFELEDKIFPQEYIDNLNAKYGLDQPIYVQYFNYMKNALTGNFDNSMVMTGMSVTYIIGRSFPASLKLGLCAFFFSLIVGVALGTAGALSKSKKFNYVISVITSLGISVPNFFVAMLLMILLGVKIPVLPIVGLKTPLHYILPTLALSFNPISMICRLTRNSLRDVLSQDYIVLARSKGTSERRIVLKHCLKNAFLPVLTYSGPQFSALITGSFVIESLFSIPGIGYEFVSSVSGRDYTLIMGLAVFLGVIVILINLLTDILSAILSPQIKLEK
ncbi:MAG: ABC transporter permease [Lachnospiraceae bacterium]|nr:ABC transporter permease [Lachnospiraceae bacterium]